MDVIACLEVTCIEIAMQMVIVRGADFGATGCESQDTLDASRDLFATMEPVRLEAGRRMGFGDVSDAVAPKIGLIAPAREGGHFATRYSMPWATHPTLVDTGSQCLAACALASGTVSAGLVAPVEPSLAVVRIEHESGEMAVPVNDRRQNDGFEFHSTGIVCTARLIARGQLMVPGCHARGTP